MFSSANRWSLEQDCIEDVLKPHTARRGEVNCLMSDDDDVEQVAYEYVPPCCMDRRYGRIEPYPCSGLCGADILGASEVQHTVQHVGRDGHVWTTASVQGKNGRSATWSGAVMCPASTDAVRMTAGHDEFHGSGPNHLAAHFVPWPSRVFPIPA